MMKTLKLVGLAFMIILSCISCYSCSEEKVEPAINLYTTDQNIPVEGSTTKISFEATTDWSASSSVEWCSITPVSGKAGTNTIVANVKENMSFDDRQAIITIVSGNINKSVTITQKQCDELILNTPKIEVDEAGGEVTVEINSNIDFSFEIEEKAKAWIKHTGTRALSSKSIVLDISKNENITSREGHLYVKSGKFSEIAIISQAAAKPFINLDNNDFTISEAGEKITIKVDSNIDYVIEMPKDNWISKDSQTNDSFIFTISENETYDNRSVIIAFKNTEYGISETVNITQLQKDAIILSGTKNIEADSDGDSFSIELQSNIDYVITCSEEWVKEVATRALGNYTHSFIVEKIPEDVEKRTASITISSAQKEISETISVTQVSSVKLEKEQLTLLLGAQETLSIKNGSAKDVTWTSSNPSVVSIDRNGLVKAQKVGEAIITITSSNGKTSSCKVIVKDITNFVYASYNGGSIMSLNGLIQYGSKLNFFIYNKSPKEIFVKSIQLIDGETYKEGNVMSVDTTLAPNSNTGWSISVGILGIHSPICKFVYTYQGKQYTTSAQYSSFSW